jgi:cytochrome c oxidase assembly protein subunit 15
MVDRRTTTAGGALHGYAVITGFATFVLIIAGGLVTSTDSGLAVPDWPLSYGMLFPPMVGGIFYEHGHRMIAGTVGLMMAALAIWTWRRDARAWVRRLAWIALGTVVIQAILGGITVLWFLPPLVSTSHLGTAMLFFALVSALAVTTSRGWTAVPPRRPVAGSLPLPRLAALTTLVVYAQILLGAAMRHTGAGLACPDFPLCNGAFLPPLTSAALALHLSHRVGAVVVAVLVLLVAERAWARHPDLSELRRPALAAVALVGLQVLLGALSVLSRLSVGMTTAHVAGGALLLCSLVVLTLRAYRRLDPRGHQHPVTAPRGVPA